MSAAACSSQWHLALAVLHDLVEIALQSICNLADLCSQLAVEVRSGKRLPLRRAKGGQTSTHPLLGDELRAP
jgi:hypothetical protein